jgi:ribonuclease P protein subunit RPR2
MWLKDLKMENPKHLPQSNASSQQWNHLYQIAQFSLYKHVQNRQRSLNEHAVSGYYAYLSVNVAKKSLLKIEPQVKRHLCKGCEGLLLPGVTARVRFLKKPSSVIEWKCIRCQARKKFPSIRHYKAWFENSVLKCQNIETEENGQKIDSDYRVKIKVNDLGLEKKSENNVKRKVTPHMICGRETPQNIINGK